MGMSNGTDDTKDTFIPVLHGGLVSLLILLNIFTTVANIVVIICVRKSARLSRMRSNWYIVSLAAADLVVGVTVMPARTIKDIYGGIWPLGELICDIRLSIDYACVSVSMLQIVAIAYDRYRAVVYPLQHLAQKSSKYYIMSAMFIWIISFLVWVPAIVVFPNTEGTGEQNTTITCTFIPPHIYVFIQSAIVYDLPIIAMLFLYVRIIFILRPSKRMNSRKNSLKLHTNHDSKHNDKVRKNTGCEEKNNKLWPSEHKSDFFEPENGIYAISFKTAYESSSIMAENHPFGPDKDRQNCLHAPSQQTEPREVADFDEKYVKQHYKAIKTLGGIMAAFLVCWLPFCVIWPVSIACSGCISKEAFAFSAWAAYANSTINPLLYFILNKDFRQALKEICCCHKQKPRRETCTTNI